MRILLLCPYPPYPPQSGGALRLYHLIRAIGAKHDLVCLVCAPDYVAVAALAPLRTFCQVVTVPTPPPRSLAQRAFTTLTTHRPDMALRNDSPSYAKILRHLLATHHFDILQVESIEMAAYGLSAPATTVTILDQFNAEYVLQRRAAMIDLRQALADSATSTPKQRGRALLSSAYSAIQWIKLARYERSLLAHYDHILAVSEDDRTAMLRLCPAPISVIPNGVDTNYYCPSSDTPADSTPTLLFTGTLDFRPNIDAVRWFVHEIFPHIRQRISQMRLLIVGRNPPPHIRQLHDGTTIEVHANVDDIRPWMHRAMIYVLPMRIGGGVRLKLLEAMAMQLPIVTTHIGAEGVPELHNGVHVVCADTPVSFADEVIHLIEHPMDRQAMGKAARDLVCRQYDWDVITPRLERLYACLATGHGA